MPDPSSFKNSFIPPYSSAHELLYYVFYCFHHSTHHSLYISFLLPLSNIPLILPHFPPYTLLASPFPSLTTLSNVFRYPTSILQLFNCFLYLNSRILLRFSCIHLYPPNLPPNNHTFSLHAPLSLSNYFFLTLFDAPGYVLHRKLIYSDLRFSL